MRLRELRSTLDLCNAGFLSVDADVTDLNSELKQTKLELNQTKLELAEEQTRSAAAGMRAKNDSDATTQSAEMRLSIALSDIARMTRETELKDAVDDL